MVKYYHNKYRSVSFHSILESIMNRVNTAKSTFSPISMLLQPPLLAESFIKKKNTQRQENVTLNFAESLKWRSGAFRTFHELLHHR